MQSYPSIAAFNDRYHAYLLDQPCYIYHKYDGSNLRFEVNPKRRELVKVGTRTRLMDKDDPVFGSAVPHFQRYLLHELMNRINERLDQRLLRNAQRFTFFAEWYGQNSFAGSHDPNDEKHLKVFDVHVGNHGFLASNALHKLLGDFEHSAELICGGALTQELIEEVRDGGTVAHPLDRHLEEGVVIHVSTNRGWEKVKVKTQAWLERVKAKYGNDWEKYA